MLLTTKFIKSELEKLYPDLKFSEKGKEHYVEVIRNFFIKDLHNRIEQAVIKEEILSIISDFCFLIERTTNSFDSINRIDNSLLEIHKEKLIKEFNPDYIIIKDNSSSRKEEAFILSVYLQKLIEENESLKKLFQGGGFSLFDRNNIKKYFYSVYENNNYVLKFRDTKINRDILRKVFFIESDKKELVEIILEEKGFLRHIHFQKYILLGNSNILSGNNHVFGEYKIDITDYIYDINNNNFCFKTKEGKSIEVPGYNIRESYLKSYKLKYDFFQELKEKLIELAESI